MTQDVPFSYWQLPDWREKDAYPLKLTDREWRWEFVRRHPDYRILWRQYGPHTEAVEKNGFLTAVTDDYQETRRLYGMSVVVDPRAQLSDWDLMQLMPFYRSFGYGIGRRSECQIEEDELNGLKPIMFDLTKPLKPQIDHAKKFLLAIQSKKYGKALNARKLRRDLWATYLRALDAKDSGARLSDMQNVFWPRETKTRQSARDTYDRAVEVRNNFPI